MIDNEKEELDQFEYLIQGLIDNQYGVFDDFFSPPVVSGLKENLVHLNDLGSLKIAGIGNNLGFQINKEIRSDKFHWIEENATNLHERNYLEKTGRFIQHLNRTCFTSIKTFESHYANFEIGSFYKKHIDQFKTAKGRQFSIILYLNDLWKDEDGGHIVLYPKDSDVIKIAPLAGRFVFFKSGEMEHEVLPSLTRERSSIAGWLKN